MVLESQRNNLLEVEEVIWRQQRMDLWLKHGDKNTKFFHGKADQRRKTNATRKLKDDNGIWWKGDDHCERILVHYFSELFSSSLPINVQEACSIVKGRLKPDHISWCEGKFTSQEVK